MPLPPKRPLNLGIYICGWGMLVAASLAGFVFTPASSGVGGFILAMLLVGFPFAAGLALFILVHAAQLVADDDYRFSMRWILLVMTVLAVVLAVVGYGIRAVTGTATNGAAASARVR